MTTDEHFRAAVKGDESVADVVDKETAREASEKTAQNAAQYAQAETRSDSQALNTAHKKPRTLPGSASSCEMPQLLGLAGTGFEPATSRL